jgi:hypothetical protein
VCGQLICMTIFRMLSINCVRMCDTNAILRCNYAQLRPRSVLGWPLIREIITCYAVHLAHCVKIDGPSHAIAYVMPGISCSICVTRLPMGGRTPAPGSRMYPRTGISLALVHPCIKFSIPYGPPPTYNHM